MAERKTNDSTDPAADTRAIDSSDAAASNAQSRDEQLHADVKHDDASLNLWGVVLVLLGIAVTFACAGAAAIWILNARSTKVVEWGNESSYGSSNDPLPLEPQLESLGSKDESPASQVFTRQLAFEHRLTIYGRTKTEGFVHVPIDRAIEIAAKQLPVRGEMPADSYKTQGLVGGGEANSGRIYRGPPPWFERSK